MMAWIFVQGKVDVQAGHGGPVVDCSCIRAMRSAFKIHRGNKIVIIDIHTYKKVFYLTWLEN
jgi:hypothetical protein